MKYTKLRTALLEAGYTGEEAAQRILICKNAYSNKLNGKSPWTLDEVYGLIGLLGCGPEVIPVIFPDRKAKSCG